ncbi:MAG: 4Fe-4S dicluster domain-containing protein [Planctomycetota bacterium]
MERPIACLVVGAGPAGLAAALTARRALRRAGRPDRVVVLDKAPQPGAHCVSGAICDPAALDLLLGRQAAPVRARACAATVAGIELHLLTPGHALRLPRLLVPPFLRTGGLFVEVPALVAALETVAADRGVEIYHGLAVQAPWWRDGRLAGVLVGEGNPQRRPSTRGTVERIPADCTIVADGACGNLSEILGRGRRRDARRVWSLGLKAVFAHDAPTGFAHLAGWPLGPLACGGGFCYRPGDGRVHAGLIAPIGPGEPPCDPVALWRELRAHPLLREWCGTAPPLSTGARLLPESGLRSAGPFAGPGWLAVGDAAGLVDARRQRGLELALRSGVAAGRAVAQADPGAACPALLDRLGVFAALRRARNFRQAFALPGGPALACVQEFLPLAPPHRRGRQRLRHPPTRNRSKDVFAARARCRYPRHALPHVAVGDTASCRDCIDRFGAPCVSVCPGGVYACGADRQIRASHENCLHCRACAVACPHAAIAWSPPAEGGGPCLPPSD